MSLLGRLRPLDLAAAAVALTALAYLVVGMRGSQWTGTVQSGYLKAVPLRLVVAVDDPLLAGLAAGLAPGRRLSETPLGREPIEVGAVEPAGPGRPLRLHLRVVAAVDGQGRAFWGDQRLRRGEPFWLADGEVRVEGRLAEVEWPRP